MDLWLPPKPAIIQPAPRKELYVPSRKPMPARRGMLVATPYIGLGAGGDAGASFLTFTTRDGLASTTHTHTVELSGSGSRRLILAISHEDGSITGVTVGGEAATEIVAQLDSGSRSASIWSLITSLTGTQSVVVTMGSETTSVIGYFEVPATWTETDEIRTTATGTTISGTIDIAAGGAVFGCVCVGDATPGTQSWVGLVETYQPALLDTGTFAASGGFLANLAAETNRTITMNSTASETDIILMVVSFGPP